ncbi:MAG: twin-arginine translocase TatA/TatE family subunit [Elsteraceae bacterium]
MGSFSVWHWLVVLAIVLLLFGAGKIPRLAGDLAKGIKNFKQGMKDEEANGAAPAATTNTGAAPPPPPPVLGPDGKPIVDQPAASAAPAGQSQTRPS